MLNFETTAYKKSCAAGRGGFSLTEILLAILIFAMTVTPLIQIFIQSTREAESAADYYQAHNILSGELEKLRSLSGLYPETFRKMFPLKKQYKKTVGKYSCEFTVDPLFELRAPVPQDGSTVSVMITEVAGSAEWRMNSGRMQRLEYNTSFNQ